MIVKNKIFKFFNYSFIVLFFAILHTLNNITYPDVNPKLVFLWSLGGKVCTIGSDQNVLLYNLSSLIVFGVLIINYLTYIQGNKYNIILKEITNYITVYNLFFILLLLIPNNKFILYFAYLNEITRLSLFFNIGYYTIIYIITLFFLILMVIGHFKVKKLKISLIFYSLISFLLYVIGIDTLIYLIRII